jgi:peptidyl-prolyl cis-trans isomerase SurA
MPALTLNSRLAACAAALLAFVLATAGPDAYVAAQTAPAQKAIVKPVQGNADKQGAASTLKGEQSIVALVNDEPVTAYQVEQRARFLALNADVGDQVKENFQRLVKAESTNAQLRALQEEVLRNNPGKSREELIAIFQERQKQFGMALQKQAVDSARATMLPRLKKDAREELIDERLKVQAAKKLGIEVTDADVKRILTDVAERNKMTYDQFTQHLKSSGVDIATMGDRFRAQKAWRDLIGRRYAAQVSVTQRDIDRVLSSAAAEAGADTVELQVHKISLALASTIDQTALTKRYAEAEGLRRNFAGCRTMADLVKGTSGAKFEDMRFVKPSAIAEPMRSMLLSAKDGDMLPPFTTAAGVEIYALCSRRALAGDDAQRSKALQELQSKELEILARTHMRNLRQEADIEYR